MAVLSPTFLSSAYVYERESRLLESEAEDLKTKFIKLSESLKSFPLVENLEKFTTLFISLAKLYFKAKAEKRTAYIWSTIPTLLANNLKFVKKATPTAKDLFKQHIFELISQDPSLMAIFVKEAARNYAFELVGSILSHPDFPSMDASVFFDVLLNCANFGASEATSGLIEDSRFRDLDSTRLGLVLSNLFCKREGHNVWVHKTKTLDKVIAHHRFRDIVLSSQLELLIERLPEEKAFAIISRHPTLISTADEFLERAILTASRQNSIRIIKILMGYLKVPDSLPQVEARWLCFWRSWKVANKNGSRELADYLASDIGSWKSIYAERGGDPRRVESREDNIDSFLAIELPAEALISKKV